jgi:hypothetical protein
VVTQATRGDNHGPLSLGIRVYIPLKPVDRQELHDRIVSAIGLVDVITMNKMWDELLQFHVTRDSHIDTCKKIDVLRGVL